MSMRKRQEVQALLREIKKVFTYEENCHMIKENKHCNAKTRRVSRRNAAERDAVPEIEKVWNRAESIFAGIGRRPPRSGLNPVR